MLIVSLVLTAATGLTPVLAGAAALAPADSAARMPIPVAGDSVAHAPPPEARVSAPADSTAGRLGPGLGSVSRTDSAAVRPSRRRGREASRGTSEAGSAAARPGLFDAPRWVMLRSVLFPGWGQLQNHAWLKAAVLGGADAYLRVRAFSDERRLRQLEPQVSQARDAFDQADQVAAKALANRDQYQEGTPEWNQADAVYRAALEVRGAASLKYNSLAGSYNSLVNGEISRLWLLGGVLVYAMVDAYVDAHFRHFKIEFEHDPALPGGKPPTGRTRLFLRWVF